MGSPITFSGFNSIDFNTILNAVMTQASIPLTNLQAKQTALATQQTNFSTLQTRLSSIKSAATDLSTIASLSAATAKSGDPTSLSVSASGAAIPGHFDVVVSELARPQVTVTETIAPDADVTAVATAGALTVAGVTINVAQPVTLRQLAEAINASDAPVSATLVNAGAGAYRLVLTGASAGTANGFTVTNTLSGGLGVAFADSDANGISGDVPADNAVQAANAELTVNNIAIVSASNTLTEAIPGVTLTLLKKSATTTIGVDVAADPSAAKVRLAAFVTAHNSFATFITAQSNAARSGDEASIGRNAVVRSVQTDIRASLLQQQTTGGQYTNLSQIGLEFSRTGTLELNQTTFDAAMLADPDAVKALLAGDANSAFARVAAALDTYTKSSGLLTSVKDQLTASIARLGTQIDSMSTRLTLQRTTLQREFVAAETAMTRLKNQSGSLGSLSSSLTTAS